MVVLVFSLAINCCYRPLGYLAVFVSFFANSIYWAYLFYIFGTSVFRRGGTIKVRYFLCTDVYVLLHNNYCIISYGDIDTNSSYYVL